jgi:hypothetical protein
MTLQKTKLTLPVEVLDRFRLLAEREDTTGRDALIKALREAKWTLQSIADGSELTRERVRQIASAEMPFTLPQVPQPPQKAVKAAPVYIEPEPAALARMLELKPFAEKVRANSPLYREEAREYTELMAEQVLTRKVTKYRMAKRLGITHAAVRARLVRYEYTKPAQGGTSRIYTVVDKSNRA